jgi:prepilin-type N-terminal cleavage/methylation domain-containing protein
MHTITLQPLPPSPRGHKFLTCAAPVLPSPRGGEFSTCRVRPAFTLVELLVVIVILAMLASLVTVAASRAMTAARNAAIKAEIDMLHMAIMNYKNEYGSFPPCSDTASDGSAGLVNRHLSRLFPRGGSSIATAAQAAAINPETSLVTWLSGYTNNPASPISPDRDRKKLYDFDRSRISGSSYRPSNKPGSPFIYVDSAHYTTGAGATLAVATVALTGGTYFAHRVPASPNLDFVTLTQPAFNPDSFQILCAGADEIFGNDDDLSNFWPSTRRAFLDSLNQ